MGLYVFALDDVIGVVYREHGITEYTSEPTEHITEIIQALKERGDEVVIVCNQPGPAYRMMLRNENYPTVTACCRRLILLHRAIDLRGCTWFLATWDNYIWEKVAKLENAPWLEDEAFKQNGMAQINQTFIKVFEQYGLSTPGVCDHPDWRMPGTRMLEEVMKLAGVSAEETVMVAVPGSVEAEAGKSAGILVVTKSQLYAYLQEPAA